ncbi:MAG: NADH-quinone oxidoreductase subunit J [Nitriliruptorales bacterium]|nr:NADH-quinone oxidoreductase subunit J [Nitriliruptorales bacterium]
MAAAVLDVLLLAQEQSAAIDQNPLAETIVFWVFAVIALGSGIAVITMRNIVHSALMLVLNLLSIAALYLALQSQFLGIIQVLVYAGAIMVLFLFVIMLLGVDRDDLLVDTQRWHRVGAVAGGALLASGLLFAFSGAFDGAAVCGDEQGQAATAPAEADFACRGLEQPLAQQEHGSVSFLAERMFTRWTFPFEAASLLLVVATIGALVLGRREDLPRSAPVTHGLPGGGGTRVDEGEATTSTPEGTPSDAERLLPERRGEPGEGDR